MAAHAAVGIDYDFAAGEPGVAVWSADYESASGVDVIFGGGIHHVRGHHGVDDVFLHLKAQIFGGDLVVVLRGYHDGFDALGLAIDVFDTDLAFAVGTQEVQPSSAPDFAQLPDQFVGQHDGHWHQLFGLVAGIA